MSELMVTEPTLLSRVDACLALPAGEDFRDYYRSIELTCWDGDENEYVVEQRFFQPRDETASWTLYVDGYTYRMGQVSGSAMSWVCYEREGEFA